MVFYFRHFLSWCPLHCSIAVERLQCCCYVRRCAMKCIYSVQFVCSRQLPHAPDIWQRQFGCCMSQYDELSDQPHHSHSQAFHLSTSDQPFWRDHILLHQGSFERVADRFLGMKKNCMQIETKQFDFYETHFPRNLFKLVQLKNKSFWLEISWTKRILQNFWKGNRNLIKQNSTEGKWAFFKINCKPFCKRECFLSGILLLNMLNLNRKKWTIRILSENILGNFVLHETKKWTTCDVNCKPFDKCEYFASGILSLNMLNSNVKKLMKHSFKQKPLGKFVFHETKQTNSLPI